MSRNTTTSRYGRGSASMAWITWSSTRSSKNGTRASSDGGGAELRVCRRRASRWYASMNTCRRMVISQAFARHQRESLADHHPPAAGLALGRVDAHMAEDGDQAGFRVG